MKKLLLIGFALGVFSVRSKAQSTAFSGSFSVSDSEVNYQVCPFDKDAPAVVFLDDAISTYNDDYNLITYHHVKLKILTDKGLDYGDIRIPFYSDGDFETITDVTGMVYYNDGSLSSKKIDKNAIYTSKVNDYWSEVKFAFPEIKKGSIIEYYYTSIKKNYGGLKEWDFQQDIPVLKSRYVVTILPGAEFAYAIFKSPALPIQVDPDRLAGQISFEMDNLPGLRNEKYIDSKNDYLQKVTFQLSKFRDERYMTTWDKVNYELTHDGTFYGQLKKNLEGTGDLVKALATDSSDLDKMKKVFQFVQGQMLWNHIYSKYSADGIKKAWDKKSGTSAEINLILIDLLKEAGLDAEPVLVSTRSNGKVDPKVTMIDQFNTVYACVSLDHKRYYLDACDKFNSYRLTPYPILNTTGFLIGRRTGTLINITDSADWYQEVIQVDATVNPSGVLEGDILIKSYDYARQFRLKNTSENSSEENKELITGGLQGLSLSGIETDKNTDDSLALTTKSGFSFPLARNSGYFLLPGNLLSGLYENPFVADYRFSNINFGYKQFYSLLYRINYDEGFTVEALPQPVRLRDSEGDLLFVRSLSADSLRHQLLISATFEIKNGLYPAEQYDVIRDFYKKFFDLINQQIVFKKK